jgi:hypothetical protein
MVGFKALSRRLADLGDALFFNADRDFKTGKKSPHQFNTGLLGMAGLGDERSVHQDASRTETRPCSSRRRVR